MWLDEEEALGGVMIMAIEMYQLVYDNARCI